MTPVLKFASILISLGVVGLVEGCSSNPTTDIAGTAGKSVSSQGGSGSGGVSGLGGENLSVGGNTAGAGGSVSSGGVSSSGGTSLTGGSSSSGGSLATGGSQQAGGSAGADAGSGGTGGAGPSDGGASDAAKGGASRKGGSGAAGTGGSATGGTTGSGGATSSFWPTAYKATLGPTGMNAGQNCMSTCHNHGFALGGTVYDSSGAAKSQVEIGIKLASGQFISVFSGSKGNFYYKGSALDLAGADIRVRDANGESAMPVNPSSSGACNSCHTGSAIPRITAP